MQVVHKRLSAVQVIAEEFGYFAGNLVQFRLTANGGCFTDLLQTTLAQHAEVDAIRIANAGFVDIPWIGAPVRINIRATSAATAHTARPFLAITLVSNDSRVQAQLQFVTPRNGGPILWRLTPHMRDSVTGDKQVRKQQIAADNCSFLLAMSTGDRQSVMPMAKEHFFYPETQPLFKKLEQLSQRSGVSRGEAFQDWLTAMVCALAAETKEDEYLAMVERHKDGKLGRRGVDLMPQMFGELVDAISRQDNDVLGDLFQGAVSHGENDLYLTPAPVATLMSRMAIDSQERDSDSNAPTICDPCCGTGILLIEAGKISPRSELVGQDIDARCVKISAINLGLRAKYGWVVCGNSLSGETRFAYRIGSFLNETPNGFRRGVIRDVPPDQTPVPVLVERTRCESGELLGGKDETETTAEATAPTIIEVPQWLARLEPRLAAMESDESVLAEEPAEQPTPGSEEPRTRQQWLF